MRSDNSNSWKLGREFFTFVNKQKAIHDIGRIKLLGILESKEHLKSNCMTHRKNGLDIHEASVRKSISGY